MPLGEVRARMPPGASTETALNVSVMEAPGPEPLTRSIVPVPPLTDRVPSDSVVAAASCPARRSVPPWRVSGRPGRRPSTRVPVLSSRSVPPLRRVMDAHAGSVPLPLRANVPSPTRSEPLNGFSAHVRSRRPAPRLRRTPPEPVSVPAKLVLLSLAPTIRVMLGSSTSPAPAREPITTVPGEALMFRVPSTTRFTASGMVSKPVLSVAPGTM